MTLRPAIFGSSGTPTAVSVRTGLLAVILVATAPLALLLSYQIIDGVRDEQRRATAELRRTAGGLATGVDRLLASTAEALASVATAPILNADGLAHQRTALLQLQRRHPEWGGVFLLDGQGEMVFDSTGSVGQIARHPFRWSAITAGDYPGRKQVSALVPVEPGGAGQTAFAIALETEDGKPSGAWVGAWLPAKLWQDLLRSSAAPDDGFLSLVDQDHRVIASTWTPVSATSQALPTVAALAMEKADAGVLRAGDSTAGEQVVAWQRTGGGWRTIASLPAGPLAAAASRATAWAIVTAGGSLLLGLALGLWLARRLIGPLHPLASGGPADEPLELERARWVAQEQAARLEAESANRAKDEFLATLGHELRNPLGAISSAVEVLQRTEPRTALADRAMQIVGRQTIHLGRTMDGLLDVAHVLSGKVVLKSHPLDLALLTQRVTWSAGFNGQDQQPEVRLDLAPVMVNGDAMRLEQVVTNLLGNAFRHTPADRAIEISTTRDGADAVLRVRDPGDGIPTPLLDRGFDLFVQGERSLGRQGGGRGVGLTLVRRLMLLHDGSVSASSSDEGHLFEVRMPALPTDVARDCTG